jgi:DNA-binding transcriptional MerR regulator
MNTYSRNELARAAGVGRAAIKHYVQRGLLPNADRHGSNPRYDDRHLYMLMAIKRLRANGARGRGLAAQITSATFDELRAMAGVAPPPAPAPPAAVLVPPPRTEASLREAVDALVCTVAEALDASPRTLRPALAALFRRMHAADVTAEQAARVIETARVGEAAR